MATARDVSRSLAVDADSYIGVRRSWPMEQPASRSTTPQHVRQPSGLLARLCGRQSTRYFAFYTPKYVTFMDAKLCTFSWTLRLIVLGYIIIYTFMYKNKHFLLHEPRGFARLQLQRPTEDHCNPNHATCDADYTLQTGLPYCDNYNGSNPESAQYPCEYIDEKALNPDGHQHHHLFIPTRITHELLSRGSCSVGMSERCANVYQLANEVKSVYVADVERFTLLIDHAYSLPDSEVSSKSQKVGGSTFLQGYLRECKFRDATDFYVGSRYACKSRAIPCFSGCQMKDDHANNPSDKVFSISVGDIISVHSILKTAGVDLRTMKNVKGESRRYEGFAIRINVEYSNLRPFMWPPWKTARPLYVYDVEMLPLETYKEVRMQQNFAKGTTYLHNKHGIFVEVSLTGEIAMFDLTRVLIILSTSLSLLVVADSIVDFAAQYAPYSHGDHYVQMKYADSANLNRDYERLMEAFDGPHHGHNYRRTKVHPEHLATTEEGECEYLEKVASLDYEVLKETASVILSLCKRTTDLEKLVDAVAVKSESSRLQTPAQTPRDPMMVPREPGEAKTGSPVELRESTIASQESHCSGDALIQPSAGRQ